MGVTHGGRSRVALLPVGLLLLSACRSVVGTSGPFGETVPPPAQKLPVIRLTVTTNPGRLPDSLQVGQRLVVRVEAVLPSGTRCYPCTTSWHAEPGGIAEWTVLPDEEGRKVAELRLLKRGDVTLGVELCPAVGVACQPHTFGRRAVR